MPYFNTQSMFLGAAAFLISSVVLVNAQDSSTNLNLTVTFTPSTQDTCGSYDSPQAISWTTDSTDLTYACFNVVDLFEGNATSGFLNQTPQVTFNTTYGSQTTRGIAWSLHNKEAYDASANYSRVLYYQIRLGDNSGPGKPATRSFTVHDGPDCSSAASPILPWVGWSCTSNANGDCKQVPYNIRSFGISTEEDATGGKQCWSAALTGSASFTFANVPKTFAMLAAASIALFSAI